MARKKRVNGEMTNAEIYKNWKEAASRTKQLRILADINETSVATIQHIIDEEKAKEEAKQNIKAPEPVEPVAEQSEPVETVEEHQTVEPVVEEPKPTESEAKKPVNRRYVTQEMDEMAVELYNNGVKVEQIAEQVGVNAKTLKYHLRKAEKEGKIRYRRAPQAHSKPTAAPAKQAQINMCSWADRLRGIAGNTEGYEETVIFLGDKNHASVKFKAGGVTYRLSIERLESEKNPAD